MQRIDRNKITDTFSFVNFSCKFQILEERHSNDLVHNRDLDTIKDTIHRFILYFNIRLDNRVKIRFCTLFLEFTIGNKLLNA